MLGMLCPVLACMKRCASARLNSVSMSAKLGSSNSSRLSAGRHRNGGEKQSLGSEG
jgi:hypothetical protein